jgi:hypothetical protein
MTQSDELQNVTGNVASDPEEPDPAACQADQEAKLDLLRCRLACGTAMLEN